MINGADIFSRVQTFKTENFLDFLHTIISQNNCFALLINLVMLHIVQLARHFCKLRVGVASCDGRGRDNEWRSSLVNQDRVYFVNNRVMERALAQLLSLANHVVAQVVKPKLVIRAISDISLICLDPSTGLEALHPGIVMVRITEIRVIYKRVIRNNNCCFQAQEMVYLPHPSGITLGKIIVDRHNMHALAG